MPWGRQDLRIIGVVRSGSQLTPDSYADIIMPYTLVEVRAGSVYAGLYSIVATVKDDEHLQALKEEIDGIANRLTQSKDELLNNFYFGEGVKTKVVLTKGLETHPMHVLRTENRDNVFGVVTGWQLVMHYAGILFVLLFVPALNLCGIVAGRMERRSAEMAVRKTFGARRTTLLNQVIAENLVLTTIGGIIGLVFSSTVCEGKSSACSSTIARSIRLRLLRARCSLPPHCSLEPLGRYSCLICWPPSSLHGGACGNRL